MQLVIAIPFWLLLWAILSSPLLLGFYLFARYMRRRAVRSTAAVVVFSLVATLLVAPVPTPIITVFLPHAFVLIDSNYYPTIANGPPTLNRLWPWVIASMLITFGVALAVSWRYLRRPTYTAVSTRGDLP
ncbi:MULTISPECIES: hypothetical protein [Stenotrophomonas]|uniref:hypothetical protein n=1 Tax=Stenotrophomonas TaxID=40323 RepID=UPI0008732D68|nr:MULTISPECIES: hypothetical protein [Stenotrophomonas]OEZ00916.1 hypothetical protein BIY45_09245 [Stenotrophomonas sp. BIIR7]